MVLGLLEMQYIVTLTSASGAMIFRYGHIGLLTTRTQRGYSSLFHPIDYYQFSAPVIMTGVHRPLRQWLVLACISAPPTFFPARGR
jgi:hypothetical protein